MYKVSLQAQGKFKANHYIEKTVLLLISVGKEYHEGEKFSATIDKINQSAFGKCIIAVADSLQRHNYGTETARDNYNYSLMCGDEWLKNNAESLSNLKVPNEIIRWDTFLNREDYKYYYDRILNEYYSNENYRACINETINVFAERNNLKYGTSEYEGAFYRSLFYILEECPIIMPMWAKDGIDFIIYPKSMTAAMSKTREVFVEESYSKYANWLSLKFKKKSQSSIEVEQRELMNE
ncbi:hypothetical protein [Xenorhabdus sp. IM139775]|uniref:hypothetical protein n=1 Tax=Xenorhabdus sp. IM139775 TaxID=3025876 RepID=UPI002359FCD6|nr:hypothetical protein [Xenorhabdus sp. IM139775]MDC9593965.1 hypothetical protein [Xenorhabdus sp. IM139775]